MSHSSPACCFGASCGFSDTLTSFPETEGISLFAAVSSEPSPEAVSSKPSSAASCAEIFILPSSAISDSFPAVVFSAVSAVLLIDVFSAAVSEFFFSGIFSATAVFRAGTVSASASLLILPLPSSEASLPSAAVLSGASISSLVIVFVCGSPLYRRTTSSSSPSPSASAKEISGSFFVPFI